MIGAVGDAFDQGEDFGVGRLHILRDAVQDGEGIGLIRDG